MLSSLHVDTMLEPEAEKNALVNALGCLNSKTGLIDLTVIFLTSHKETSLKVKNIILFY